MISAEKFYGGAKRLVTSSGNVVMLRKYRLYQVQFTNVGSHDLKLPDATKLQLGTWFYVFGLASSQNFTLKDFDGSTVFACDAATKLQVTLYENSDSGGSWAVRDWA